MAPTSRPTVAIGVASLLLWITPVPAALAQDAWFGRDKALHFSVSAALGGATYAAAIPVVDPPWQRALLAGGVTLGIGAAKELYDAAGYGHASARDMTWNLLGCAVAVGLALLLDEGLRAPASTLTARVRPGLQHFHISSHF